MPSLPPAAKVIRVALKSVLGDDMDVLNIFHILGTIAGPYAAATLTNVAADVFTSWTGRMAPQQSSSMQYVSAEAKDLSVVNGGVATYTPGAPVAGGVAGNVEPANVAICVSWKEFLSYRGGHPRTYCSGIAEAGRLDPQHIEASYAAGIQLAGTNFIADLAGDTVSGFGSPLTLCVVHYRLNDVAQTPPIVSPILACTVNTRYDSQRRRLGA
jgi:hypothetical protein